MKSVGYSLNSKELIELPKISLQIRQRHHAALRFRCKFAPAKTSAPVAGFVSRQFRMHVLPKPIPKQAL